MGYAVVHESQLKEEDKKENPNCLPDNQTDAFPLVSNTFLASGLPKEILLDSTPKPLPIRKSPGKYDAFLSHHDGVEYYL